MSQSVLRADPAKISPTLKEAVVDSLLNLTYAQLSGQGPTGQYIFGARPRALLNSGFLLPQRSVSGDDEVTSPIWVSSHGLQMQLNAVTAAVMTVSPRFSVYVRVLPREEDLRRPNCRPVFMLRQALVDEIKAERDRRLEEEWEKVKGSYTSKWKHPGWPVIRARVVDEVYKAKGVPRHILTADVPQDEADVEADEALGDADSAGESTKEGVPVKADESLPIKDEHFEPLTVPHKWMRLEVQFPPLELDIFKSSEELQRDLDDHAARMNAAVAKRVAEWAQSDDPDTGGKAWGYRLHGRVRSATPPNAVFSTAYGETSAAVFGGSTIQGYHDAIS
ncbi:hypothetical protein [Burkholderia sp. SCN-KJ]|uniref:hypothetical protein n=1 Tax=Burkholderia sp. SCN-KJ TaxID=2969248 RepID=UPI00214FD0EA|nr:hypothetical protein [Burkholderia sp. SCN-KJ]MCR4466207.1 hypothetical protein [Burkholderia sp. SCN-KJ]